MHIICRYALSSMYLLFDCRQESGRLDRIICGVFLTGMLARANAGHSDFIMLSDEKGGAAVARHLLLIIVHGYSIGNKKWRCSIKN